jgi:hemolysin III
VVDGSLRWRLGPLHHPVRGLMDAGAAVLAVVGAVVLALRSSGSGERLALAVYGASLVGLFVVSALYHSIPWTAPRKRLFQRLDHSMISLLVAGTCTAVAGLTLDGWVRPAVLVPLWLATFAGLLLRWSPHSANGTCIALQATTGWVTGLALVLAADRLGRDGIILAAVGGALYTIGMILLLTRRPRLWPRVFSYHEVFHVLVIGAATCHWLLVSGRLLA